RKIMNPAFGPAQIRRFTATFVDKATELRNAWQSQVDETADGVVRIDVLSWLSRTTLDIVGLAGFNYSFNSLSAPGNSNELHEAFKAVLSSQATALGIWTLLRAWYPVLRILPSGPRSSLVTKARDTMKRVSRQLLNESKRAVLASQDEKTTGARDLLTLLVKSNMDEKETERINDDEVVAQIPTFLLAGHETTSTATTWALYALSLHPDVQRKLRDELLTVPGETPTMDELNALPYLDACVREVLRIHPPVAGVARDVAEDGVIPLSEPVNGKDYVRVRKGQGLILNIIALNRSKKLWGQDAMAFK
ncbi:hypothetical protein V5O48_013032, partial [Marasmius crinis-equi]